MTFRGALLKPSEKNRSQANRPSRAIATQSRYERLKGEVRNWWEDRFKVGEALKEIREGKLYQDEYRSFEEFTEAEFGIKRTYAHRLIEAAQVKESVKMLPIGNKVVHESQARALAPVPIEQREEVLTKVVESGPVTAKAITETAKAISVSGPSPKPEKVIPRDKTGYPIPDDVFEDWREAESFSDLLRDLHRIKLRVEKAVDSNELVFREISNTTVATLKNAWSELQQVLPHAVCPVCQGRTRKNCTVCKQRGFVSEFGFKHWFPKETLELREKAKR
ncbi:MAG TPA: hypothetical protein VMM84_14590 [Pyrinomonadaceae bacterium]|nr:hypothetical protein [Pyrinomonadaceae bacterium]